MPEPILVIDNVSKVYPGRRGMFGRSAEVQALKGISIAVDRGESFGLVGESGSGKTTLTRSILHLEQPTSGRILFEGRDLATLSGAELRRLRARAPQPFARRPLRSDLGPGVATVEGSWPSSSASHASARSSLWRGRSR